MLSHFPDLDAKVKTDLPVADKVVGKRKNSAGVDVDFMLSDWIVEKMQERDERRDARLAKRMDKIVAVIDSSSPANVAITAGHLKTKLMTGWRDALINPQSNLDE